MWDSVKIFWSNTILLKYYINVRTYTYYNVWYLKVDLLGNKSNNPFIAPSTEKAVPTAANLLCF